MKYLLTFLLVLSLNTQNIVWAKEQNKTYYDQNDRMNMITGVQRFELLTDSAVMLENPGLIKPVGDMADSQSAGMYMLTEMLAATELTANEVVIKTQSGNLVLKCNDAASDTEAKLNDTFQLYAQGCIIYEFVNSITSLMKEADALEKQNIEAKAALNQASAETAKRENDVAKSKKKLEDTNKLIKAATAAMKKAKDEVKKATEAVEKASKALEAANAIECGEDEDGSCASAKAAQVAAASKALEDSKKQLEKANKNLEKAVAKMVNLLVDKLGVETGAVLALLAGTVRAETAAGDVSFQVSEADYSLANLGKVISELTGTRAEKVENFIGSDLSEPGTGSYFNRLINNYEEDEKGNNKYSNADIIESSDSYMWMMAPKGESLREILDVFSSFDDGVDYIQTIAMAVGEYSEAKGEKEVKQAEAMKTPQSRTDEMARKIEDRNELRANLKKMINQNLDFLDKSLTVFKSLYNINNPISAPTSTVPKTSSPKVAFYEYINTFATDKLKRKAQEGYFSTVNFLGIQKAMECYAKGGDGTSCKDLDTESDNSINASCHWSGFVVGPSKPITEICNLSKVGQTATNESGNTLTCVCANP